MVGRKRKRSGAIGKLENSLRTPAVAVGRSDIREIVMDVLAAATAWHVARLSQPARLLRIGEVRELLAVCDDTVRKLIASGDLPAVRIGTAMRVHPDDLTEFQRKRRIIGGGQSGTQEA